MKLVPKQPAFRAALRHLEIQPAAISMHAARCQMFDLLGGQFAIAPRHLLLGLRLSLHTPLHTLRREIWRDEMELNGTPKPAQVTGIAGFCVMNWGWMKFSGTRFWRRGRDSNPR